MIRRIGSRKSKDETVEPKSFDDFELRLGDVMRGERATMGKSLLDVQRELRIKAAYISAIENADPEAFDTPGFIAGYVRSYARYLGMDPDKVFATFCEESGFQVAHGMSAEASVVRKAGRDAKPARVEAAGAFGSKAMPFAPEKDGILTQIEPRAVGSMLVLMALISGIGFGGWTVLKEVQRVQVAPVDQTPVVLSDLDPLSAANAGTNETGPQAGEVDLAEAPRADALDRLYRPQALDVPVMVARDAPIATLDPRQSGAFANAVIARESEPIVFAEEYGLPSVPQVVEAPSPELQVVAVRSAWVRVRAADGTTIFEGIMEPGSTWTVPSTEVPPSLRVGESGAVYFAMDGNHYGPAGPRGTVSSGIVLERVALAEKYVVADPSADSELERYVVELQTPQSETPSE